MAVHTATEIDSEDHATTYGGKRTDNKLDTLLGISIPQRVSSRTEHNAKLETNPV